MEKYAKTRLTKKGGEGAFREFVELILTKENLLDTAIQKYLKTTQQK
jgi:3-deoxy-D-manno-octulosonate 8-phosphate phosphatase KdsC-like HAD superfamily phosphatase